MAVYTKVSINEVKKLLQNYNIGDLIRIDEIQQGVENSNFKLTTKSGNYILTLYEKRVNPEDLPYFIGLMNYYSERGIPCPKPIVDKHNNILQKLSNKDAAIISFLPGKQIISPNHYHCFQLGELIGKMHLTGLNFSTNRNNSLGMLTWKPLFKICQKNNHFLKDVDVKLINTLLDKLEKYWPNNLKCGQIHADLFTDNIFFEKENLTGVIDFYFSCSDILIYDLAITINDWCFNSEGNLNFKNVHSIISGYSSIRDLKTKEFEAMPILLEGAALRFFLTRLYDWVNTNPDSLVIKKDPIEYLNKIKYYQNIDQFDFLEKLKRF